MKCSGDRVRRIPQYFDGAHYTCKGADKQMQLRGGQLVECKVWFRRKSYARRVVPGPAASSQT